jgi:signal transduction histidine kinase
VTIEDALPDGGGLSRDQEVVVLRAVQEALTNVRRHARARHVGIRLVADDLGARVEIGDDGVGFAPEAARRADGGFGLVGMRGRVAEVGGEVDVASAPGRGTRVTVRLPATAAP